MKGIDYGRSRNMKISLLHQIKNSGKLLRPPRKQNILPFPKRELPGLNIHSSNLFSAHM